MSDDVTPEMIEAAKARDARFRTIDLGLELQAELAKSRPLWLLMSKLRDDAEDAMQEFSIANCGDTCLIQGLQSRVFRYRYAIETFERILNQADNAHASVRAEDLAARERDD